MSELSDMLLQTVDKTLGAAGQVYSPHVVLTAPDGEQLWIPVPMPSFGSKNDGPALWPHGFKVSLALGAIPQAPNVTDSVAGFVASHSWELFSGWLFSPSPSSIPPK